MSFALSLLLFSLFCRMRSTPRSNTSVSLLSLFFFQEAVSLRASLFFDAIDLMSGFSEFIGFPFPLFLPLFSHCCNFFAAAQRAVHFFLFSPNQQRLCVGRCGSPLFVPAPRLRLAGTTSTILPSPPYPFNSVNRAGGRFKYLCLHPPFLLSGLGNWSRLVSGM